jgi:hypothetical protein
MDIFPAVGTVATIALLGFGGPALVNTIQTATDEGFTGTAIVNEHHIAGSFCNMTITQKNGDVVKVTYGPKMTCYRVQDGMQVEVLNGRVQK